MGLYWRPKVYIREEKSLRHVPMEAKFLNDHKPKILLKTEFALFQTQSLLQFHLICQVVANSSGAESHRTVFKLRKKKRKKENFCVVFTYCIIKRVKLGNSMSQSCNDG